MAKTKIVCTIGPASDTADALASLIREGMSVARLNFSHGTHEDHAEKIRLIREVSASVGKPVAILQDLCGPKIRVGKVREPGIRLEPGNEFILSSEECLGEGNRVSVSYSRLPGEVKPGDIILLADGMMELVVKSSSAQEAVCEVIIGGVLTSNKGINLPSGTISTPSLTDKDKDDLAFGLSQGVDYVALSFVRRPEDIHEVKTIIEKAGQKTPVIAKIEKHEALEQIDGILQAADGVMVARGDLGVEIPLENVPRIQKMLVEKANNLGKPVIIATQMLRSMVDSPRPTRAEANDVANAVLDGADAVMLSEETASGKYPIRAVQYMNRIAESAEKDYAHGKYLNLAAKMDIPQSVAYASCVLADHLDVAAVVAPTQSGFTATQISRFRPRAKIIALSPDEAVVRKLSLYWGCYPTVISDTKDTDEMIDLGAQAALETGLVTKGDLIVITAGHPVWVAKTTNMMRVKQL